MDKNNREKESNANNKDSVDLYRNIGKDYYFLDINNLNKLLSNKNKKFLENIELIELISAGSSGVVYIGRSRKNLKSKRYAFKFLFDKKNNQEVVIHNKLKHKNIAQIIGIHSLQKKDDIIGIEYSRYGDIENFKRNILKRTYLSETLILYIAGGILEALKYIHIKNKIIHMDIKQQNILIDEFLSIKLTDFSVSINYKSAKDYIDLTMVGTCYYMSLEVLKKKRILVSEASKIDIYSLGVLLYLLAFYDYPYKLNEVNSKDYFQILKNIINIDLEFPKETGHSKVFINFLKNCLNKDIKKRYDIYQAMKDPWIKGYQIILNEKEKLYNAGKFVIDLMVDNFISFNNYIKEQEKLL